MKKKKICHNTNHRYRLAKQVVQNFSRKNFVSSEERECEGNIYSGQALIQSTKQAVLRIRIPGSGAFLTPGRGRVQNQDPDPSGSVTNIPDLISESLETIFWVKIIKFFDADPGIFVTLDPGQKKFGINVPDPLTVALRPGTARTAIT